MNTAVSSLSLRAAQPTMRSWLARAGAALWRGLEDSGRARAQRHLLDFADQCQAQQPTLANELRAAAMQGPLA